jgi:hypothetical protein
MVQVCWQNKAPPCVKFFTWLLSQGRIQCRTNLVKKGIVSSATCEIYHAADETPAHIIFGCAAAGSFWSAIGIMAASDWQVQKIMDIQQPSHTLSKHFGTFLLLRGWHI